MTGLLICFLLLYISKIHFLLRSHSEKSHEDRHSPKVLHVFDSGQPDKNNLFPCDLLAHLILIFFQFGFSLN